MADRVSSAEDGQEASAREDEKDGEGKLGDGGAAGELPEEENAPEAGDDDASLSERETEGAAQNLRGRTSREA